MTQVRLNSVGWLARIPSPAAPTPSTGPHSHDMRQMFARSLATPPVDTNQSTPLPLATRRRMLDQLDNLLRLFGCPSSLQQGVGLPCVVGGDVHHILERRAVRLSERSCSTPPLLLPTQLPQAADRSLTSRRPLRQSATRSRAPRLCGSPSAAARVPASRLASGPAEASLAARAPSHGQPVSVCALSCEWLITVLHAWPETVGTAR